MASSNFFSRLTSNLILTMCVPLLVRAAEPTAQRFDFGTGPVAAGYTVVGPETTYTPERGFGFEPGAALTSADRGGSDPLRRDFVTSAHPFFFSVDLPEGNYNVTVTFGDADAATSTTVKAELRRLMLENVRTAAGEFSSRTFTVNVRRPQIARHVARKSAKKTAEHADLPVPFTCIKGAAPCAEVTISW